MERVREFFSRLISNRLEACFSCHGHSARGSVPTPLRLAHAENLLGLYVGGAAGQSQVEATAPLSPNFHENHSAFKLPPSRIDEQSGK
jgi:hypothetical protein